MIHDSPIWSMITTEDGEYLFTLDEMDCLKQISLKDKAKTKCWRDINENHLQISQILLTTDCKYLFVSDSINYTACQYSLKNQKLVHKYDISGRKCNNKETGSKFNAHVVMNITKDGKYIWIGNNFGDLLCLSIKRKIVIKCVFGMVNLLND